MASKTNTCKVAGNGLQTWSLTALREGMKILLIKGHVRSSINGFCERIRVITNASFVVGR